MKALVLAAGLGTRLKPLTDKVPKPLIPVLGVEPLFWTLSWLNEKGVVDIIVNAHHLPDQITEAIERFKKLLPRLNISISYEKEKILGSGGGVLKVLHEERNWEGGLLVLNADTLSRIEPSVFQSSTSGFAISMKEKFLEKYSALYVDDNLSWMPNASPNMPINNKLKRCHFLGMHFLCENDIALVKKKKYSNQEIGLFDGIYKVLFDAARAPQGYDVAGIENGFWFDLNKIEYFRNAEVAIQKRYEDVLTRLLKERHPEKDREEALRFWPAELS